MAVNFQFYQLIGKAVGVDGVVAVVQV